MNCGSLTDPANGSVNHTAGTTFGQTATYSCDIGYSLVGDSTRTCQASGEWNRSEPSCKGVYVYKLTFSYPMLSNFCLMLQLCFEDRFCASKKSWVGRGGQVSAWGTMLMAHCRASMCFLAHLSTSDMTTQMLVTSFIAKQ